MHADDRGCMYGKVWIRGTSLNRWKDGNLLGPSALGSSEITAMRSRV